MNGYPQAGVIGLDRSGEQEWQAAIRSFHRVVAFFLDKDYTGPVWRIQSVESIKNRWELVSKASIPASDWSSVLTLQQMF
jgi:hypothetical protein